MNEYGPGDMSVATMCPSCHGRRYVGPFLCGQCNGNGVLAMGIYVRHRRVFEILWMLVAVPVRLVYFFRWMYHEFRITR